MDTGSWNGTALGQGGKLALAWTCPGDTSCGQNATKTVELFRYDTRGNLTEYNQQSPNSAGLYGATVGYDSVGNMNYLNIPGVPALTIASYDGEGRPTQINASSGPTPIASAVSYGYFGALSVTYGSGDYDTFNYDNLGHMTTYKSNVGSYYYQGAVAWNPNGTVKQLWTLDNIPGNGGGNNVTNSYNYDDLSRLWKVSDNGAGKLDQTYTYDQYGNISTSGSPTSWLQAYIENTNQYQSVGTCPNSGAINYDANGNLLCDTFYSYTWNADNKLVTVDGKTITYDAFNRQVESIWGTEYLWVPGLPNAIVYAGATLGAAYVPLPGGGKAIYGSSGLVGYAHMDWNGASRISSTEASGLFAQQEYSPFGVIYDAGPTGGAIFDFSGISIGGEYETPNRELNAVQGRWIQPDPAGLAAVDPSNPQTWNRYAYVLNNPLSAIDPLGLDCVYLNDPGDGVAYIDHDSNAQECSGPDANGNPNGGYWIPGSVPDSSWVTNIDSENNQIGALSRLDNGAFGWTGSTNQLGGGWGTVGVNVTSSNSSWSLFGWDASAANTGNCQPPFLCNTGTGPQKTIGSPPPPKPLPHVNRAACMTASLIGNAFGNDDKTFATLGLNVAAYAKYFGPAIGLELPGPGWVYAAVAGTYDLGVLGVTYLECKE